MKKIKFKGQNPSPKLKDQKYTCHFFKKNEGMKCYNSKFRKQNVIKL